MLCCRLSFVTHWGATYFRLKCRSRSCCRCCQCAWAGLSGWTPTAGIYGRRVIVPVDIAAFPAGRSGLTPMKVTLCGVALSAFVSSITAAILILDEQTLLAMRTWLAGDLAGQDWATLGTSAWFSLGGFVLAFTLHPPLTCWHWAIAWRRGWASLYSAREHSPCLRSRCSVAQPYRLLAPLVCRPVSTADCPASGISGSARSAPSFSLCRRTFVITGRYYCPYAFHAP